MVDAHELKEEDITTPVRKTRPTLRDPEEFSIVRKIYFGEVDPLTNTNQYTDPTEIYDRMKHRNNKRHAR